MSDFPVEKKLELVQQVRSRHYQNQSDMMNREQILYGRTWAKRPENEGYHIEPHSGNEEEGIFRDNTLKIRFAIAAVLFLLIILIDQGGQTVAGISMEKVFSIIETDYEAAIDAWVRAACLR